MCNVLYCPMQLPSYHTSEVQVARTALTHRPTTDTSRCRTRSHRCAGVAQLIFISAGPARFQGFHKPCGAVVYWSGIVLCCSVVCLSSSVWCSVVCFCGFARGPPTPTPRFTHGYTLLLVVDPDLLPRSTHWRMIV